MSTVGLSLRFIRAYDAEKDKAPGLSLHDQAFALAMYPINDEDVRDFSERLRDAYAFLRERKLNIQ